MSKWKKIFKKNRTLEDEIKFTGFVMFVCLFVILPIGIILTAISGG